MKKILSINFGCRVNSAELNQLTQKYIDDGYVPDTNNPDVVIVNTCAITKKGEYESLSKIKSLQEKYPQAKIIATGCANLSKLSPSPNLQTISNHDKEKNLSSAYSPAIKDKFSHTNRYLLRIQAGCTAFCSYCIVPYRRPELWSLPISDAVDIVNTAMKNNYTEVIITGVNLNQYTPGLSNLLEALLTQTSIPLISFGSIPINCIDDKFLSLVSSFSFRVSKLLHIPIQSGSNKILKLMNRTYTREKIIDTFFKLKAIPILVKGGVRGGFDFGTDVIVGFPTETDTDFQETLDLCRQIGFSKIHTFRYSPRASTTARTLFLKSPKLSEEVLKSRSKQIRSLVSSKNID